MMELGKTRRKGWLEEAVIVVIKNGLEEKDDRKRLLVAEMKGPRVEGHMVVEMCGWKD